MTVANAMAAARRPLQGLLSHALIAVSGVCPDEAVRVPKSASPAEGASAR